MISKGIDYQSNKNQVLSRTPDKKFDSRIRLGFWNDPIFERENPKYKLMGKTRIYNVKKLNGKAK